MTLRKHGGEPDRIFAMSKFLEIFAGIRVVVAADRLEEAREIAARPIPQDVIDEYNQPTPEFVAPRCPQCGDDDPLLENAEPTNSWLCEACGHQWAEPETGLDKDS